MAAYNTKTKIIIGSPMETDTTSGMQLKTQDSTDDPSLAKAINDYLESIDSTDKEVINITSVALTATVIAVIIIHKDD